MYAIRSYYEALQEAVAARAAAVTTAARIPQLEPNDVLFVDEIHRLSTVVEEVLYPALEVV